DGKTIEMLWSILNVIFPSERGMFFTHRQELLHYQINNSNFQKMVRMGMPGDPLCISVYWGDPADSQCIEMGIQSGHGRGG
ncbi:hypothetical protein PAXRUDRAFT_162554, partial [Paxillus rubicundulus Ve08.2h10]